MANNKSIVIEKLLTIDSTGLPKAPDIRQLQDKDVLLLYSRDNTVEKRRYIGDVGVIYYLGDPRSPAKEQGLSDREALAAAIENYNLAKDYQPDALVAKLINKYYMQSITKAGVALEALQKSIHLSSVGAGKLNETLSKKLASAIDDEDVQSILNLMDSVNKRVIQIPELVKALAAAYENLSNEKEQQIGRGGQHILSSMSADED